MGIVSTNKIVFEKYEIEEKAFQSWLKKNHIETYNKISEYKKKEQEFLSSNDGKGWPVGGLSELHDELVLYWFSLYEYYLNRMGNKRWELVTFANEMIVFKRIKHNKSLETTPISP